ncbi:MAG: hypothetical protein ACYC6J_01015 [Coriobacteriia bacterium]
MRHRSVILAITLLATTLALAACSAGEAPADTAGLVPDERPVPEGMPVMYEFFTLT